MRKSGYYWRCPCGYEAHDYTTTGIDQKRGAHRRFHTAQIARIVAAPTPEEAGQ